LPLVNISKRIHREVNNFFETAPIDLNNPILLAISGGPDSLSLLYSIVQLRDKFNLNLHGIHINHLLRGKHSKADADFVMGEFKKLQIPFLIKNFDVKLFKDHHKFSLEEAARKARYAIFEEVAQMIGAEVVFLGHTADDQSETVLMNLIRGTGLNGLVGMRQLSKGKSIGGVFLINLARPLLEFTREETETYCKEQDLTPCLDLSNLSSEFTRNRVRNDLLPALELFNPNIKGSLIKLSRTLRHDVDFLEERVDNIWPIVVQDKKSRLIFQKKTFGNLHSSLKNLVVRRAINLIKGNLDNIQFFHIEQMVRLIEGETGKYMELPGGIALSVSYKDAIIAKKMIDFCPFPVIDKPFNVNIPGSTKVDNWRVNGSIITAEDNRIKSDYIAYFDMDSIKCSSMMVRTRRTGDIFQPIGMRSSKKLKNFMIDSKIPSAWRSRIPVVESEGKILWVVGYRISDWAKIQEKTEKILALSFCSDQ